MIERKPFERSGAQEEFTAVIEGNHLIADERELLSLSIRRVSSAVEEGVLSPETLYAFFCAVKNLEPDSGVVSDSLESINDAAINSSLPTSKKASIRDRVKYFAENYGVSSIAFATLISIPGAFGVYIGSNNTAENNFHSHTDKNNPIIEKLIDIDTPPVLDSIANQESRKDNAKTGSNQKTSNINFLSIPYAQAVLSTNFEKSEKNYLIMPSINQISKKEVLSIPNSVSGYPTGEGAYISFINRAASNYGVSSSVMIKIIKCESQFEPEIPNSESSGAYGIAQFMPNTFYNTNINPYVSYGIGNPYAQIAEMAKLISEGQIWRWSCASYLNIPK